MTQPLTERLREGRPASYVDPLAREMWNRDGFEAADRIDGLEATQAELVEALKEAVSVLTDEIVGTIHHDDPDWYRALDVAVAKAKALLAKLEAGQ